jgi:hypothetical protein
MDALAILMLQAMLDSDTPAVRDAAMSALDRATYADYADPPLLRKCTLMEDYILVSHTEYASRFWCVA